MFYSLITYLPLLSICFLHINIKNSFLLFFWINLLLLKIWQFLFDNNSLKWINSFKFQIKNFFCESYSITSKCKYSFGITSSILGAATLIPKHLLLMAGMTLLVDTQHRISLQVDMYFSIVRRRACWASFVSLSTSVKRTTEWRKLD